MTQRSKRYSAHISNTTRRYSTTNRRSVYASAVEKCISGNYCLLP